jgi:hypothetical protein
MSDTAHANGSSTPTSEKYDPVLGRISLPPST